MSNEVYQMPAPERAINEQDVFDFLNWWAGEAEDLYVFDDSEAKMHCVTAAKYFRWAAAAVRQRGVMS